MNNKTSKLEIKEKFKKVDIKDEGDNNDRNHQYYNLKD